MQRQLHAFEHFINALVPVSVSEVAIGSYFTKYTMDWKSIGLKALTESHLSLL